MVGPYREYALFLMTAHLITLDAQDDTDDPGSSLAGTPFKATVGSVSVENTKPNSFTVDDWNYWLNQTKYGRELLAYLDTQCAPGIFINTTCDSDLIESYVYEINALQARYNYLLRRFKALEGPA